MHRIERPLTALAADERGKIGLVAIVGVLAMLVLLGLVGNAGQAVVEKIEVQNAADAAAYSAALWQARGMNALTAVNHLMGEISGLIVLHEAIGGPELDSGQQMSSVTSGNLNEQIQGLMPPAVYAGPTPLSEFDQTLVSKIGGLMSDDSQQHGGATLYDARITLKNDLIQALAVKAIVEIVRILGDATLFGSAAEVFALAVHSYVDVQMVLLAKEWVVLEALEGVATMLVPFKKGARQVLLPALSQYGDFVAGQAEPRAVSQAVARMLDEFKAAHGVAELAVFPAAGQLRLPVRAEPPPGSDDGASSGQGVGRPPSLWKGSDDPGGAMALIQGTLNRVEGYINQLTNAINQFNSFALGNSLPSLPGFSQYLGMGVKDGAINQQDNPSVNSLPEFDWQQEQVCQWVRATYPYVDSWRGSLRSQFRDSDPLSFGVPNSMAAFYYVHWTNRYTLAESYQDRSGQAGASSLTGPPHLHVLLDTTPATKGNEPWTTNDRRAEQLFTLIGFARRPDMKPAFLNPFFAPLTRYGTVACAEALVYNANDRDLGSDATVQPNTGWDTLNWEPPVQAAEWGIRPPSDGGGFRLRNCSAGGRW